MVDAVAEEVTELDVSVVGSVFVVTVEMLVSVVCVVVDVELVDVSVVGFVALVKMCGVADGLCAVQIIFAMLEPYTEGNSPSGIMLAYAGRSDPAYRISEGESLGQMVPASFTLIPEQLKER